MKVKRNVWGLYSLLTIVLLSVAGSSVWAQVTASISGKIEDASGAAVPGAAVTATNLETGASRTVDTDEAGTYRALSLPVGRYEVRAEKAGFNKQIQTGINLTVGQQAVVNLRLEVGAVQQEVTVTAAAELVNTSTASVSGLVGEQQVKDLPLNGRSFDQLIALNAGVVNYSAHSTIAEAAAGGGVGNNFVVAGRRPKDNIYLLNGVQLTGASHLNVEPGGASGELLGVDAIREFNVLSGTYSAEYGQRPGGQVILVTQSGTNQLHGSVFEFLRNSKLDARNFFDRTPGLAIPPFKRNQFGGSAGGPIRKDKTFIFGNYEGFRQRLGISAVTFVPDLNARQGLLPNAQGVPTPVPGLEPRMLPYLAYWPLPNGPNLGGGFAETFSNPGQALREDYGTTRFDQIFSVKDSLSAVYTIDDGYNQTPFADPLFGSVTSLRDQVASVQETHIFSPQVINTFTAGFSRAGSLFTTPALGSFPSSLSFVTGRGPGAIAIGAASVSGGTSLTPAGSGRFAYITFARTLFTYQDGIQVVKGKHQIGAGAFFQRVRSNEYGLNPTTGTATFASLTGLLQGTLTQLIITTNPIPLDFRIWIGAWYVQDVIQLRPNLTLSVGLRHEFSDGYNEAHGRFPNFHFDASGVPLTTPVVSSSAFTENNAKWLFGPRVALAWDPFGKGKTSIRAGFGTHYAIQDEMGLWPGAAPPNNGQLTFANVPFFSVLPLNPNSPVPPSCGPGVPAPCTTYGAWGIQPTLKTPTVESWNFTVEQQITPNTALRVAYQGSHGFHDLLNVNPNTIAAQICSNPAGCISGGTLAAASRGTVPQGAQYIPVGTVPNPFLAAGQFGMSESNNFYNGLQVEVTRRLSRSLQFRANYTWSRLEDTSPGADTTVSALNQSSYTMVSRNVQRDWGPSAYNITHQASGNLSYELPIGHGKAWLQGATGVADKLASGWQVNGIVTLLSGFDSTALTGSNRSGDGNPQAPDRVNANPAFTGPLVIGDPNHWFDPNAFLLPTAGTYGNVGRGTIIGPGLGTLDFSLFKTTRISERVRLQFRAEFFNIFNHANFGVPVGTVFSGTAINPSAGRITSTVTTSRQIQFALKLSF